MNRLALLLAFSIVCQSHLAAEILLDGFDDDVTIGYGDVVTQSVGDSDAVRTITWRPSDDESTTSVSGGELSFAVLDPTLSGGLYGLSYEWPQGIDLSEGGVNNALLFDFGFFQGPGVPSFTRTILRTADGDVFLFATGVRGKPALEVSEVPFTIVMPFPALSTAMVREVEFAIRIKDPGDHDLEGPYSLSLSSVRVGQIPEPSSGLLTMGCLSLFAIRRTRNVNG